MINIHQSYRQVWGWFDDNGPAYGADVYRDCIEWLPDNSHIVEGGCWLGRSTIVMARLIKLSGKKIRFDAVDTWTGSIRDLRQKALVKRNGGAIYPLFLKNITKFGLRDYVNPILGDSTATATLYHDLSLDFVYIDADHSFEKFMSDITVWYPKLKAGGLLAGHDFDEKYHPDVVRVVEDFSFQNRMQFEVQNRSWLIRT